VRGRHPRRVRRLARAGSARRLQLLTGHKYPKEGPKRSYQNATKQAVDLLVDGTPLDPGRANLRDHEAEAVASLGSIAIVLPPAVRAARSATNLPRWSNPARQLQGVQRACSSITAI
jgi:hypothetical protein